MHHDRTEPRRRDVKLWQDSAGRTKPRTPKSCIRQGVCSEPQREASGTIARLFPKPDVASNPGITFTFVGSSRVARQHPMVEIVFPGGLTPGASKCHLSVKEYRSGRFVQRSVQNGSTENPHLERVSGGHCRAHNQTNVKQGGADVVVSSKSPSRHHERYRNGRQLDGRGRLGLVASPPQPRSHCESLSAGASSLERARATQGGAGIGVFQIFLRDFVMKRGPQWPLFCRSQDSIIRVRK